jgi:hypothetical protein
VAVPAMELLVAGSKQVLESLELSRLNHAANVRKQMLTLFDALVEDTATALLARWLLENRDELCRMVYTSRQGEFAFPSGKAVEPRNVISVPSEQGPKTHFDLSVTKRSGAK